MARYQPKPYREHRPTYPPELFAWLASVCSEHRMAWDAGTGSGQAAVALTDYFDTILATDIDAAQLDQARPHSNVTYRCAPAHESGLHARSVDLITVACAVHWFDLDAFYGEARRVMRSNGVLAVWTYSWPMTGVREVDEVLAHYRDDVLGPYWPPESDLYLRRYETLPFPFQNEIAAPEFALPCDWDAGSLLDFLSTWTASVAHFRQTGELSSSKIRMPLASAWTTAGLTRIELPIHLRVALVH